MAEESRGQYREFQLETRHLAAIVVLIAILCISSFLLGRWVERQAYRATTEGGARSGAAPSPSVEDVNRELTYFRTLEEDAPPPQVRPSAAPEKPAPIRVERKAEAASTGAEPASGGPNAPPAAPARASASAEDPPPPQAPAESTPASRGSVFIQVMATRDGAAAAALKSRLTSRGYPVAISSGTGAAATMRRVKVGPYGGRAEAERVARKLRSEEGLRTWIP
jgi:DedD protein